MKKAVVCILLALMAHAGFAAKIAAPTKTYYIYVKPGDKLFVKMPYKNTVSISYTCKCYFAAGNLSFICMDLKGAELKPTLPDSPISMREFATIALEHKGKKSAELDNAAIYIVEQYSASPLKYRYFKVKFYA